MVDDQSSVKTVKTAPAKLLLTPPPTDERDTPSWLIERARDAMGGIDMDPASCVRAQKTVRAKQYYTVEDNGLERSWSDGIETTRVWCNWPYSRGNGLLWAHKYTLETRYFSVGCALVNVDSSAAWWKHLLRATGAALLLDKRLKFAPHERHTSFWPSCLFVDGNDLDRVCEVRESLADLGEWVRRGSR